MESEKQKKAVETGRRVALKDAFLANTAGRTYSW